MGAAGYILAINLLVAGLFAGAFFWLSAYPDVRRPARWFAAAFLCGMAYYAIEALVPFLDDPRLVVFSAFSAFLAALVAFVAGLARRYRVAVPWRLVAVIVVLSLPLNLAIYDMPRGTFWRVFLYQLPYAAMQALAAIVVLRAPSARMADRFLAALLALGGAHFLSKAWMAVRLGDGSTAQAYVKSAYALLSQATGAVLIVAMGLMMIGLLVRDVFAGATEKSETDALTGLLNRRGFEERVRAVSRRAAASGMPASIVICDLDHFKRVNDTHGHANGDRVIVAFAGKLRTVAGSGPVLGRIGGEEFAVVLPGANLATGRLFAEAARAAFAAGRVEGLPDDQRFTASFGVAELREGDTMSDALRRADQALYEAKRAGRDCVRVASAEGRGIAEPGRRRRNG